MLLSLTLGLSLLGLQLSTQSFQPPQLQTSTIPSVPTTAVAGGEVFLELTIDETGAVVAVAPLRTTPPFTDLITALVRGWRFAPAEDDSPEQPPAGEKPI